MARGKRMPGIAALPSPLASAAAVGLSTGWDPETRNDWGQALQTTRAFSADAVELSALSRHELPALLSFLEATPELDEAQVSVHGPVKGLDGDWEGLVDELQALPKRIKAVVMHPDTLDEEAVVALRRLGPRLVLENMDCRKDDCRTVAELEPLFAALPESGFCLDVAHAWSVDHSLKLAHDLLDAFSSRLREVHLSGIEVNGKHRLTTKDDLALYADVLARCRHVPWVLESPLA